MWESQHLQFIISYFCNHIFIFIFKKGVLVKFIGVFCMLCKEKNKSKNLFLQIEKGLSIADRFGYSVTLKCLRQAASWIYFFNYFHAKLLLALYQLFFKNFVYWSQKQQFSWTMKSLHIRKDYWITSVINGHFAAHEPHISSRVRMMAGCPTDCILPCGQSRNKIKVAGCQLFQAKVWHFCLRSSRHSCRAEKGCLVPCSSKSFPKIRLLDLLM